jgi:NAD(P)-dependent dehydrogenase (short-subunit alcohol dehydrogenase family)
MMPIAERVIMISGVSRGIGLAVAKRLLNEGARLSLGVRDTAAARDSLRTSNTTGVRFFPYSATDLKSAENWVAGTVKTFGRLDGLVNNAGVSQPPVALADDDETGLDEMWAVNVKGPLRLTRLALPHLASSGTGRVVNIASLSGKRVKNVNMGYAMTKFALIALTHATRREGWAQGIRATAICPSFVRTDMTAAVERVEPADMIQPADLAELVLTALTLPNNAVVAEILVNYTLEDMF